MAKLKLKILTPEGEAYNGTADSLVAPGREGSFGILPHHAPMITALKPGIFKVREEMQELFFVTGEGFVDITHEGVTVLADVATRTNNLMEAERILLGLEAAAEK